MKAASSQGAAFVVKTQFARTKKESAMAGFTFLKRIKRRTLCLARGVFAPYVLAASLWAQVPLPQHAPPVPPRPAPARPAPDPAGPNPTSAATGTLTLPGPLRSFLRMAGISQKATPPEVIPLLAHRVYLNGYEGSQPTEFLLLLERYLRQAHELQALAGGSNAIHVGGCVDAGPLLQILGYKIEHVCGTPDAALETAESERAFLTVDSGFPLADLEEALQKNVPFNYPYTPTTLPILFTEHEWFSLGDGKKTRSGSAVDLILVDEPVARLYWAMNSMDRETSRALRQTIGLRRLLAIAPELDFYGSQLHIRGGRVLVPGGNAAEAGWKELVGTSPDNPGGFVARLYSKDDGWLAAYFDVLSRVDAEQQQHLTEAPRLVNYYEAFRTVDKKQRAGVGSFRRASELLVLDTRLRWEANGQPQVPGSLEIWNSIVDQGSDERPVRERVRHGHSLSTPDDLVMALTASSREETETGPLQLYLALCEMDRRRPANAQLDAKAVSYLATRFATYRDWFLIFAEFPALSEDSMQQFLEIAQGLDSVKNSTLKANAIGSFQAEVGLWQILARQHQIAEADLNSSWHDVLQPFAHVGTATQLFDASTQSVTSLLHAAGAPAGASPSVIVDLLAGPPQQTLDGQQVHAKLVAKIDSVLEDQQLVSLDTLFALGDGLEKMTPGTKGSDELLGLAAELRGFELPQPIFTRSERTYWAPQVYTNRHAELQVQTDLTKVIKSPASRAQIEAARGQLAAFLRDTLVGLNYAYYEPPGAQILHINPLFVRAHDFLGISLIGADDIWHKPRLIGAGVAAGGGAYLLGSMADLPFALASAEQDFIVPENVQALIWREVVPDLVTGATVPRWWDVSPEELHAVALYQRSGEELLRGAVKDANLRAEVTQILATHLSSSRMEEVDAALKNDSAATLLLRQMMPTEQLYLAERFHAAHPAEADAIGSANRELTALLASAGDRVSPARLSLDFGVPHPVLASSSAPEILNLSPFPASAGSTNRLFGESLESSNLYWARLADELGYSPRMMHVLVPEMTRVMIGKIFASDVEDWPAILRAMHEAGDDLRQGKVAALRKPSSDAAPQQTADSRANNVPSSTQEKP
jgi:hypothetical protein